MANSGAEIFTSFFLEKQRVKGKERSEGRWYFVVWVWPYPRKAKGWNVNFLSSPLHPCFAYIETLSHDTLLISPWSLASVMAPHDLLHQSWHPFSQGEFNCNKLFGVLCSERSWTTSDRWQASATHIKKRIQSTKRHTKGALKKKYNEIKTKRHAREERKGGTVDLISFTQNFDFIKSCGGRIRLKFSRVSFLSLLYSMEWK